MLKPESRQAGAFHSQSNLNEETKGIIKKVVQCVAFSSFWLQWEVIKAAPRLLTNSVLIILLH